ncbi:MAG: GIY-YIG nuclease family protein [Candidatus Staskawiczbacteria bacterium]|nr:GIY-YIG nuclease family protein [Candidatus Staskawiczbacteria bacterium]
MFYFYILKSEKTNQYYIGSTENFDNRLKKHNLGMVKSTKSSKPWKMVFIQNFLTFSEARKMEVKVKKWKSRTAIERLIDNNF